MKKFFTRILLFFLVAATIDFCFGKVCDFLYQHSTSGDTYKINYAISENTSDIIIMGSSRANHHYNPQILSDSLGLPAYNLGIDGSGIILMTGFYKLITQRYVPKYIIYDITPEFDVYIYRGDANNTRYLSQLKPYYSEDCIKNIFDDVDVKERFKLYSGLYRYNTHFINLARFYFCPDLLLADGYRPLEGNMNYCKEDNEEGETEIDELKLTYLHNFILECKNKGTSLIFVISPRYGETSYESYNPALKICEENGCPILNYFCDTKFSNNKMYFKDSYHLNSIGANEFTRLVSSEINMLLKIHL